MEVSVIIPVFNAAPFVEKAARSALMQEEVREVLLIDDGSTDGSLDIIRRLAVEDARVRLFQHAGGVNLGPGASRNVGLQHARHEFVAFLDADDFFVENRFRKTKEIFEKHPEAGGVYEAVYIAEISGKAGQLVGFQRDVPPGECLERFVIADEGFFSIVGLTVKTAVLREWDIRFKEGLFLAEDLDFIMELCNRSNFYPGSLQEPVVVVQRHGNNTTDVPYSMHSKYRFILFRDWMKKIRSNNWSARLNWFIVKSYLEHLPLLRSLPVSNTLKKPFKGIYLAGLLLRFPWLAPKIFTRGTGGLHSAYSQE